MTRRLIETWLPIAALGEESVRERRSMTALPPTYYLHVWWARRPLVASRAAILASLLPADADHGKFTHLLGIHGDPVASRKRIDIAKRTGERFEGEAYTYSRAFTYMPTEQDIEWFGDERERIAERDARVLDPTAGGGSVPMSAAEREVYEAVEDYISSTYNNAAADERTSVGFVMTIYRRRLASSFQALKNTLSDRLEGMGNPSDQRVLKFGAGRPEEDLTDDETSDEAMDTDEAVELERQALDFEEKGDIERLLAMIARLPSDTKAKRLEAIIEELAKAGHKQVIVFTQYTDTLDYLRDLLVSTGRKILCFSGRGGEYLDASGNWRTISREETKRRFRNGDGDILLATDAAAEGLNFQFCGALVNFDSPWNPMRVEQRIGRIDRLGQQFPEIRIVNLMYEDTVETDVYRALRNRIGLFTAVVGKLQPILASLPRRIADATLAPSTERADVRNRLIGSLDAAVTAAESGFDIDEATAAALEEPMRPEPPYTLDDLRLLLQKPELLPPGVSVQQLGSQEFSYRALDQLDPIRVTTDPDFYQDNPESTEFWTPGNPLFPAPSDNIELSDHDNSIHLSDLL